MNVGLVESVNQSKEERNPTQRKKEIVGLMFGESKFQFHVEL